MAWQAILVSANFGLRTLGDRAGVESDGRPGRRQPYRAYNFTLLKYAGNNKWYYEEDIYNPAHFKDMVRGWMDRKKKLAES